MRRISHAGRQRRIARRRLLVTLVAVGGSAAGCGGDGAAAPVTTPAVVTVPSTTATPPTSAVPTTTAPATTAPASLATTAVPEAPSTGELPPSFSVVVHERAVSTEYPLDRVPPPFEGWTTGDYDLANERAYLTRVGQAEPGDIVCAELLARDGNVLVRETSPSTPNSSFTPVGDELTFDGLVAELASIPVRFEDLRALVPGAPPEGPIDVSLAAADSGRLVEALSTMGIAGAGFTSARVVASPTPEGLVGAATVTVEGDGTRFASLTIEIAVAESDGRSSSVSETATVTESGVCDPVATLVVGEWSVGGPADAAPLGTLSITADGAIELRLACYEGGATATVGPFGLTSLSGLEAPTGCGEAETALVRLLQGPDVLVATVGDATVLAATSESESAVFMLTPA